MSRPSAYVSLPPGVLPLFSSVALRNSTQKGVTIDLSTADGGFDPVRIEADVGDRLELVVFQSSGPPMTFGATVPNRRAPTIVRTNLPKAGLDAAGDLHPTVVFSEPINAATLNPISLGLYEGGASVAGAVALVPGRPWTAEFTPAGALRPGARYELLITRDVRDLDGDELEARTGVEFTTSSTLLIGASGRLAFATENGPGGGYVYVANVDGTALMQLPGGRAHYSKPSWSPDGRRILVGRSQLDSHVSGIYIIDVDPPTRITRLAEGGQPAWSPDGKKIAFLGSAPLAPNVVGIFVMNADGTGVKRITSPNDPAQCTEGASATDLKPDWAPDGSRIVFERDIHTSDDGGFDCGLDGWGYAPQVQIVNADGSGLRRLSSGSPYSQDSDPAWSPDGEFIALRSNCCGLAIVDAEGAGPARTVLKEFTFAGRGQFNPAWSPDGRHLLFVNVGASDNTLFTVDVASGTARPLNVHVPGTIRSAAWAAGR